MLPAFVLIVEDIRGRSRARDVAVRAYGGEIEPRESGETDAAGPGRTGPSG